MKKVLLLLLIISVLYTYSTLLATDDISYKSISTNFNGIAFSDDVILAYGTNGVLLRSSDKGQSWQQIQLAGITTEIPKIKYDGDEFYGIIANTIIRSKDGISWTNTAIDSCKYGLDILKHDNEIIVLQSSGNNHSINIYDNNLNLKSKYSYFGLTAPGEFAVFHNKLILPYSRVKNYIFDLKNNFALDSVDFSTFRKMTGKTTKQFRESNGKLCVLIDSLLYQTDSLMKDWVLLADSVNDYCTYKDKIYRFNSNDDKWRNLQTRIDFGLLESNGEFSEIYSKEDKKFYRKIEATDIQFINDSLVVVVGYDRFVCVSYDAGKNWSVKSKLSRMSSNPFPLLIDSNKCVIGGIYAEVNKTFDGGVTWQGIPFTDTLASLTWRDTVAGKPYVRGYGFDCGAHYGRLLDNDEITFVIMNNVVNVKNYLRSTGKGSNYSPDWDEYATNGEFNSAPIFIDSMQYFFIPSNYSYAGRANTKIIEYDAEFFGKNLNILDSMYLYNSFYDKKNETVYALQMKDTDTNITAEYSIVSSDKKMAKWSFVDHVFTQPKSDSNSTHTIYSYYNSKMNYIDFIDGCTNYKDKIYAIKMYRWDANLKQITSVVVLDSQMALVRIGSGYITDGKKAYLHASNTLFINDDIINTPSMWRKEANPIGIIQTKYVSDIKDRTLYAYLGGNEKLIKITFEDMSSGIDYAAEKRDYLYSFPAFPNPAKEYVKSRIYWDASADINNARINVYNSMGERVAGKNDVEFERLDEYSGELRWNCAGMPVGTYLIQVEHGNTSQTIRLVVSR